MLRKQIQRLQFIEKKIFFQRGPRPPSGKNQGSPSRAFRTTLFRRDHARIQQKLQRRDTAEEKTMLGM